MTKKNKLIQVGGNILEFSEEILDIYDYVLLPSNYDFISDNQGIEVFKNNKFNPQKLRSIFILGKDATFLSNFPLLLEQLPAYQIIYESNSIITTSQKHILEKKFALPISLEDKESQKFINEFIFDNTKKQLGYKLSMDYVEIKDSFQGVYKKNGNTSIEVSGDFGNKMNQIAIWKMHPHGIAMNDQLAFIPEIMVLSGNIYLEFQISLIDTFNDEIITVFTGTPEEFRNQKKIVKNYSENQRNISVSLYAKGGEGKIEIGNIHFRGHIFNNSAMIPYGTAIFDEEIRNEELFFYFHPGDYKPPLAVYFSGYRSAEGFEGRGMMGRMGCPFILIGDPRLEGGNFYIGSDSLEKKVIETIKEKLTWLGFTKNELVLSGLSMGTFGSLYYAPELEPKAVIIGKPLASIGKIAVNERISRPEMWGTSLDMVTHFSGHSSNANAEKLNQKFWNKFDKGNFNNTIFAIAYMKNDDYDGDAFELLNKSLTEHSPNVSVRYKGFIGRHNDNTIGVNRWFIKQYRNILWKYFARRIDYRL